MNTTTETIIILLVLLIIVCGSWWIWSEAHKPKPKEMTCNEKCKSLGYISGECRDFSTSNESEKCGENEVNIGLTWDCVPVIPVVDKDTTCCCKVKEDKTADWETYRNEEYGFEVKYSPEIYGDFWTTGSGWWLGIPDLFSVSFHYRPSELVSDDGICDYSVAITVVDNQQKLSNQEWLQKYGENVGYIKGETKGPEEINISNTEGIKLEKLEGLPPSGGNIDGLVITSKDLKIYLISLNIEQEVLPIDAKTFQDQCFTEGEKTFNQMLSTFRFVDEESGDGIKVIYPNGDEEWKRGNTYTIQWQAKGLETGVIDIYLVNWSDDGQLISSKIVARKISPFLDSYSWEVPLDIDVGNKYKISIQESPDVVPTPRLADKSDGYFSILSE